MSRKSGNLPWVAAIFGLALCVRLIFILAVPVNPIAGGDPRVYEQTALNILHEGKIYSEEGLAFRSPLYPIFIAGVYLIFGPYYQSIFLVQALLGAISAILIFQSLRPLSLFAAVIGGSLFVFHPLMLFYTKQVLTESLYVFLLSLLIYLTLQIRDGGIKSATSLGIVMGLATLCRSETLLLCIFILIGLWVVAFRRGRYWRKFATVLVVLCIYLLTISPWVIRNFFVVGAPVLSTNGGIMFYQGNSSEATGGYIAWEVPDDMPNNEVARSDYFFQRGIEYLRANLTTYPLLLGKKVTALWLPNDNLILDLSDILLIPLSIIGLALALWDRSKWHFCAIVASPIAAITMSALIFHGGNGRYRTPMYGSLIMFAAVLLAVIVQRMIDWQVSRHRNLTQNRLFSPKMTQNQAKSGRFDCNSNEVLLE